MPYLPKVFVSTPISSVAQATNRIKELNSVDIAYQVVGSFGNNPRLPPLFLEGSVNCNLVTKFFTESYESRTVGCYRLKSAFILGKGLVANMSGQVFTGLDLIVEEHHLSSSLWRSPLIQNFEGCYEVKSGYKEKVIHESAILLAKAADHIYGHWLVDILPRIEVAELCGFRDLRYIVSINTPSYAIALLRLLNISDDRIIYMDENSEIIYCENLILPSVCRFRGVMSSIALGIYNKLISSALVDRRVNLSSLKMDRRIYLSRKKWSNSSRRLVNLNEVEALLERHGFEIIFPEDLSMSEQILLFQSAICVVGEGGSALHNTVFGRTGCHVAVLQGNNNGNFLQSALGDMKQQKTGYFFGDSFLRPGNGMTGDFIIPIPYLNRILKEKLNVFTL